MKVINAANVIDKIIKERNNTPVTIVRDRYLPTPEPYQHGMSVRGGLRKALRIIEQEPAVDVIPVRKCKDCALYHSPLCMMVYELDEDTVADWAEDDGYCHRWRKQ